MINIGSQYKSYEDLYKSVGIDKINDRYNYLYEEISAFISRFGEGAEEKLKLNERILMHCVLEYFEDILKVKSAHGIEHTNSHKVNAYMAYWLLRRHPIQIIASGEEDDDLVFANEKFVLSLLMSFLTQGAEAKPLVGKDQDLYIAFINTFYYYLKFRRLDPQTIEMILMSFRLGGVFPECKEIQ